MEAVDLCIVPKMQRFQSTKEKQMLMRYVRVDFRHVDGKKSSNVLAG
jgi:hypothetical protein